jgi:hypothetical protein
MNPLYSNSLREASSSALAEEDRRYNERNQFLTRVQIRRLDQPHVERMGTTQDLSRDGLYFVVRSHDYTIGMKLRLTLPDAKSEWIGEVVRTECLPNGGQGVGVIRIPDLAC